MADQFDRLNILMDGLRSAQEEIQSFSLDETISMLEEYRGVLNRLDMAATIFAHRAEVVAFVESIRDGYPLRIEPLATYLGSTPRRGSGWGMA